MSTDRFSPQTLRHTGTILGVLSLLAFVFLGAWFWQANAAQDRSAEAQMKRLSIVELGGKNLSTALDKQRAQFLACADALPNTPGCNVPVVPPAALVAPQIITGPVGPQGYQGIPGADSTVPGPAGKDSVVPGPAGKDSVVPGIQGRPGADSVVPGPAGKDSTVPGPQGQSAYPFTFSFNTTSGLTYTCILPAAGERGTCTETTSTPTATATP